MPRHGPAALPGAAETPGSSRGRGQPARHRLDQSEESWAGASSESPEWEEATPQTTLPIGQAVEEEDVDLDMRSQTSRTSRTSRATTTSGAPPRSRPRRGPRSPRQLSPPPEQPSGQPADPAPREAGRVAARPATRRARAAFQTLGLERSHDVIFNTNFEISARLTTFKWKQLLLMLRARQAVGERRWRRPGRWLAGLTARELASLWGHLGAAAQRLRGPDGPSLLR